MIIEAARELRPCMMHEARMRPDVLKKDMQVSKWVYGDEVC